MPLSFLKSPSITLLYIYSEIILFGLYQVSKSFQPKQQNLWVVDVNLIPSSTLTILRLGWPKCHVDQDEYDDTRLVGELLHAALHLGRHLLTLVHQLLQGGLNPEQLHGTVEHLCVELAAGLQLGHKVYPALEGPQLDNLHHLLLVAALDPSEKNSIENNPRERR